jgi:hypothetical protein
MDVRSVAPRSGWAVRARTMAGWPLRLGPATSDGSPPATPFRRLAVVHLFSTAGDAMVTVALAGSVFVSVSLSAARGRTALGLLCTFLPFLVVGPFLGSLIDRTPGGRKAMLCVASLGRAGGCLLMAFWIHGLMFFPAVFFTLVCSKAYLVSRAALLPNIVERAEDLVPANAKLAVASSAASSAGGVVGAAVYKLSGPTAVLHLDMVVLVVAAVLAARLRPARLGRGFASAQGPAPAQVLIPAVVSSRGGEGRAGATGWASLPPGGLNLIALSMATMRAVAGLMTALVVFAFRHDGAPLYWYGLVGAASVVGNLAGAALAPLVRERLREERIVVGCAAVIGVVALAVTSLHTLHRWPAAVALAAAVTLLAAVAKLAFDALVQRDGVPSRRGRLFARFEALFQGVWVIAALIPVLVATPLLAGFAAIGLATLAAAGLSSAGLWLAGRDRLPCWWPGAVAAPVGCPVVLPAEPGVHVHRGDDPAAVRAARDARDATDAR